VIELMIYDLLETTMQDIAPYSEVIASADLYQKRTMPLESHQFYSLRIWTHMRWTGTICRGIIVNRIGKINNRKYQ
jgi:hypothetical protein